MTPGTRNITDQFADKVCGAGLRIVRFEAGWKATEHIASDVLPKSSIRIKAPQIVEIFFRTLKSGCRVEQGLLEKLPRTLNCLAVYSIRAWRVMYLCRLGRECPDLDCEIVFSPSE